MNLHRYLIALLLLVVGCSGPPPVHDYDPLYDFSVLRSYAWMPPPIGDSASPFSIRQVEAAVHRELRGRGYGESDTPDFFVVMRAKLDRRLRTFAGSNWQTVEADRKLQGALILEIMDGRSRETIWLGMVAEVFDAELSAEERRERIDEVVPELLGSFPP